MKIAFSERSLESFRNAPPGVQRAVLKQTHFHAQNLQHPSLHTKKYDERRDVWQARVNRNWRFYFTIQGDTYNVQDITAHPK